jgi:hypothetical protein
MLTILHIKIKRVALAFLCNLEQVAAFVINIDVSVSDFQAQNITIILHLGSKISQFSIQKIINKTRIDMSH